MEYLDALELQRSLHHEIAEGQRENTLLLVEHPSVYTAGKRTQDHERPNDGTPVIDVDRGGKITWHGLGQIVGYPIVRLAKPTELVGFVREIENALIATCSHLILVGWMERWRQVILTPAWAFSVPGSGAVALGQAQVRAAGDAAGGPEIGGVSDKR